MILMLISFLAMIFTPIIYSIKYTAPLFGEKEVKRREYLYASLAFMPMIAGLAIIFLIIAFMPPSIAKILSELLIPLGTAIWFMLGLGIVFTLIMIVDKFLTSKLQKTLDP